MFVTAEWTTRAVISFIGLIINTVILTIEIKRREASTVIFTTKLLQYSSFICIVCGFLANLFWFLSPFNGFCHFSTFFAILFGSFQPLFMGFYQLSRLYYCFANDQIHSNKGYPKWLFIVMIIIGILLIINFLLINQFGLKSECGINANWDYYHSTQLFIPYLSHTEIGSVWTVSTIFLYLIWDIATLLLYIFKIIAFKRMLQKQPIVYKRVLFILSEIFILTIFYEIALLFAIIITAITSALLLGTVWYGMISMTLYVFVIVSINYSMHLMMEYNVKQYIKFLKLIYYLRCHFICCKFRFMIIEQLNELQSIQIKLNHQDTKAYDAATDSQFETRTISVNNGISKPIHANPNELSIETTGIKK